MYVSLYVSGFLKGHRRTALRRANLDTKDSVDVVAVHLTGAPNGNFRENICSEDDLRSRIFGTVVVKFLACLLLLGFSNIYKMV